MSAFPIDHRRDATGQCLSDVDFQSLHHGEGFHIPAQGPLNPFSPLAPIDEDQSNGFYGPSYSLQTPQQHTWDVSTIEGPAGSVNVGLLHDSQVHPLNTSVADSAPSTNVLLESENTPWDKLERARYPCTSGRCKQTNEPALRTSHRRHEESHWYRWYCLSCYESLEEILGRTSCNCTNPPTDTLLHLELHYLGAHQETRNANQWSLYRRKDRIIDHLEKVHHLDKDKAYDTARRGRRNLRLLTACGWCPDVLLTEFDVAERHSWWHAKRGNDMSTWKFDRVILTILTKQPDLDKSWLKLLQSCGFLDCQDWLTWSPTKLPLLLLELEACRLNVAQLAWTAFQALSIRNPAFRPGMNESHQALSEPTCHQVQGINWPYENSSNAQVLPYRTQPSMFTDVGWPQPSSSFGSTISGSSLNQMNQNTMIPTLHPPQIVQEPISYPPPSSSFTAPSTEHTFHDNRVEGDDSSDENEKAMKNAVLGAKHIYASRKQNNSKGRVHRALVPNRPSMRLTRRVISPKSPGT